MFLPFLLIHISKHPVERLQRKYESDADFVLMMRLLPALAFVPPTDVIVPFDELTDSVSFPPEAQPVLDYFEDT